MERENLFTVDISGEDSVLYRSEFILRQESPMLRARREELSDKFVKLALKGVIGIHSWILILTCLLFMAGLCLGANAIFDYYEAQINPVKGLCLAGALLLLSGIVWVISWVLGKKADESILNNPIDDEYDLLEKMSERELKIPSDTRPTEVFCHLYQGCINYGEPYDVEKVSVFEENGVLCLHVEGYVIGVPIDSVESVVKLGDTITFKDWYKDAPHDCEEYSKYNIVRRQVNEYDEEYSMNGYYSIRFAKEDNSFEILVPLYEIEPFLHILKLDVTEE